MLTVIIVIHLMLVLGLIGVVLLQKSEGGGLVSSTSGFLIESRHSERADTCDRVSRRRVFRHQPFVVVARKLRAPSDVHYQYRRTGGAGSAGRRRTTGTAAEWRERPAQ